LWYQSLPGREAGRNPASAPHPWRPHRGPGYSRTEPNRCFPMCRNIKPLYHFEPPVTDGEIHSAALQFVRKVRGFSKPSQSNAESFDRAVRDISKDVQRLMDSLISDAPLKNRDVEAAKAKARSAKRFGRPAA